MCTEIVVRLVAETMSLWAMTGMPISVCTYEANGAQWKERQAMSCSHKPSKIPPQVLEIAKHNACAGSRRAAKEQ